MVSDQDLIDFIARQRHLLDAERESDLERSSLVLTSCGPKLLELKGLALNNLGVVSVSIGLGGKRFISLVSIRPWDLILRSSLSLIELERPAAYHTSQIFPPHTFREARLNSPPNLVA